MNIKKLLSESLLYGLADVCVLLVGGFLLLPLYTRSLSKEDFGVFVVVRANIEILTYVLSAGIPSAVARLYFLRGDENSKNKLLKSVLSIFVLYLIAFCLLMVLFGDALWRAISPNLSPNPYLAIAIAIATFSFFGTLASTWLRIEGRVVSFTVVQVASAVLVALVAFLALLGFHLGSTGIFLALFAGSAIPTALIPLFLRGKGGWGVKRDVVSEILKLGVPISIGYLSFFALNRANTLLLQYHVPLSDVAVYGVAQQLSAIIAIAATSFGKAFQPIIFGSSEGELRSILDKSSKIYLPCVALLCSSVMLLSDNILGVAAPDYVHGSFLPMILLLGANFMYASSLISDTTILHYRKPYISTAISLVSGCFSIILGALLMPRFELYGAALALLFAHIMRASLSQFFAWKLSLSTPVTPLLQVVMAVSVAAFASIGLHYLNFPLVLGLCLKFSILAAGGALVLVRLAKGGLFKGGAPAA